MGASLTGWATLGVSLARAEDVVTVARLRLEGKLEPDTVSRVEGRAERYTLPLPGGPWHSFTAEAARANEADSQLYSSELGIAVEVATTRLPGIGRANLEVIEARMRALLSQAQPGLDIVSSRELPGPWDNGRLVRLRGRLGGLSQEGAVALYTWGDRIFRVTASAPAWRYHDVAQRLEELVVGFQYEPPPRPFLSAEVARKVTVYFNSFDDQCDHPFKTSGAFVYQPLPEQALTTIQKAITSAPPGVSCDIWMQSFGGAMADVAPTAAAFHHRQAQFILEFGGTWKDRTDEATGQSAAQWTRDLRTALQEYTRGSYVNFVDLDLGSRSSGTFDYLSMYYGDNVSRLRAVKSAWDPTNLFQFEQSIPPQGSPPSNKDG